MLTGFVVHTKATHGEERFAVTTASGPLREALTDHDDPLAQHYGLPRQTLILLKIETKDTWIRESRSCRRK